MRKQKERRLEHQVETSAMHDESPQRANDGQEDVAAAQRLSTVQFMTEGVATDRLITRDPEAVREQAAAGIADGGARLPHLEQIQASFGPHDVSHVRAHVGGAAAGAADAVGAKAYAAGDRVAFREQPDLFLAAHEAAHVVQQRGGVQLKDGTGRSGDEHERQADAVAERVVAGRSAADLLSQTGGGAGAAEGVQMYEDDSIKGEHARISDTGKSAVVGQENYAQKVYATADLIQSANDALAASGEKGSYIRLARNGDKVKRGAETLECVRPVFQPQGDAANEDLAKANKGKGADETMSLWADCGRSSRTVMGSHSDASPHAVYTSGGTEKETRPASNPARYSDVIYPEVMQAFMRESAAKPFLKDGVHYTSGDPASIIKPRSPDHAREQYWELGEDGRRAFDAFAGINTGANPVVGGGYTMNTEYAMPGFKGGRRTWNFHWAGVVMKDGADIITLENYADGNGYDSVNMEWNYQMYGTVKKGQTFHEQHLATNTHGTRASTFAVKPEGD